MMCRAELHDLEENMALFFTILKRQGLNSLHHAFGMQKNAALKNSGRIMAAL
jgi:hypothetical protein